MRQASEFETGDPNADAWDCDAVTTAEIGERIDLDRVVWDPEYRVEVLDALRPAD